MLSKGMSARHIMIGNDSDLCLASCEKSNESRGATINFFVP